MSTPFDFELHYQYLRFENECLKRTGKSFQEFFELVMTKSDNTFTVIKPWGRQGDEKCDGISHATGTFFQVYAPEGITAADTIKKIDEDFTGAVKHWKDDLKVWTFVWSGVQVGLPPDVETKLQTLRKANTDLVIEDWSRDRLWQIVAGLTPQERADLLGPVPQFGAAGRTTAAEVAMVLNWLAQQPVGPVEPDDGFEQTALGAKISLNDLSEHTASLVGRSLPIVREVARYVAGSVDGDLNKKIAGRLVTEYERRSAVNNSPDGVFVELVDYVAGGDDQSPETFWAAVGIVSHYFELCDIFKR